MATSRPAPHDPPTAAQLMQERAANFAQDGQALLTAEAVRAWLGRVGLALYVPRPDQMPVPAPSLLEAVAGAAAPEPTGEQKAAAQELLIRLVAEGALVPLNLFGGSVSDMPDFVCSPAVFSFLFTLRGNKAWKAAPVTSGPVKVSPLALNTYDLLAASSMRTAAELARELGNEVTEVAVLRALCELWQQLRVLPVPQADGAATQWELATTRYTKQIKSGANAGQPTALSALISLYLQQAVAAAEDEVETFLSPLAPRSRLRSILHDLLAARQLDTVVVDGKTLVHLAGGMPAFQATSPEPASEDAAEDATSEAGEPAPERIQKFKADPAAKLGKGLRVRPAGARPAYGQGGARPAGGRPQGGGSRFGQRSGAGQEGRPGRDRPDRQGGVGRQDGQDRFRPARPQFDRPWAERGDRPGRPDRAPQEGMSEGGPQGGFAQGRPSGFRDGARPPRDGQRPTRDRAGQGGRERPDGARGGRPFQAGGRPPRRAEDGAGASGPERRPYRAGAPGAGGFRRQQEGSDSGAGYTERPARPRTYGPKQDGGDAGSARPFRPRTDRPFGAGRDNGSSQGEGRPAFRPQRPGPGGPGGSRPGGSRSYGSRAGGGERSDLRGAGSGGADYKGSRGIGPRPGGFRRDAAPDGGQTPGERPPFRRFDAPRPGRPPARRADDRGAGARPGSRPGGKPAFSKRPFPKRPGPGGDGGVSPVRRRPDEE